jgi:hypothetical protein
MELPRSSYGLHTRSVPKVRWPDLSFDAKERLSDEFASIIRVVRHTARGYPYLEWEPPMPRIKDEHLDCVIYLYPSQHDLPPKKWTGLSCF